MALNGLEEGDNEITVPIKLDTVKAGEVCATISMTPHDETHAAPDADSVRWFVDEEAVAPCCIASRTVCGWRWSDALSYRRSRGYRN